MENKTDEKKLDLNNFSLIREWKKTIRHIVKTSNIDIGEDLLEEELDNILDENFINLKGKLHNNYEYVDKLFDVDLIMFKDWLDEKKFVIAGNGTIFLNQYTQVNPAAKMLQSFLAKRKEYKDKLKIYKEDTYEWKTANRLQLAEKVNANAYYGVQGSQYSSFFNIYSASSVTATGQSLISTTMTTFEEFMANNMKFYDLNDCFDWLYAISKEKDFNFNTNFTRDINVEEVFDRLKNKFKDFKDEYEMPLFSYLMNLSDEQLIRIYYKNNIFEFSSLPVIKELIVKIITTVETFKDPNKIPEEIKDDLELLWEYYKEFIYVDTFSFNRINRLKEDERKVVVVVDTDSNMLNLEPWFEYVTDYIIQGNDEIIRGRDEQEIMFIIVNMISYVLTQAVKKILAKYTKNSNIPKEFRSMVNMKNEYLFSKLILSNKKKRYISSIKLKEGKLIEPEKSDIKGHDFMKSSMPMISSVFISNICEDELLYAKNINIPNILRKLDGFRGTIRESLESLSKDFIMPKRVNEVEGYKEPFKQQSVKGLTVWNTLFPEKEIVPPDNVTLIKVRMPNPESIEKLGEEEPQIYSRLVGLMKGEIKCFNKNGVEVIAIPRVEKEIPEWIKPYIDYNTIVSDNIKPIFPVLRALGVEPITATKKHEYMSNIVEL